MRLSKYLILSLLSFNFMFPASIFAKPNAEALEELLKESLVELGLQGATAYLDQDAKIPLTVDGIINHPVEEEGIYIVSNDRNSTFSGIALHQKITWGKDQTPNLRLEILRDAGGKLSRFERPVVRTISLNQSKDHLDQAIRQASQSALKSAMVQLSVNQDKVNVKEAGGSLIAWLLSSLLPSAQAQEETSTLFWVKLVFLAVGIILTITGGVMYIVGVRKGKTRTGKAYRIGGSAVFSVGVGLLYAGYVRTVKKFTVEAVGESVQQEP